MFGFGKLSNCPCDEHCSVCSGIVVGSSRTAVRKVGLLQASGTKTYRPLAGTKYTKYVYKSGQGIFFSENTCSNCRTILLLVYCR